MGRPSKYSPELRERAVRLVQEHAPDHPPQMGRDSIGRRETGLLGGSAEALVRQAERDAGRRLGLTTDERQRLKQLERENFELKRANETQGQREYRRPAATLGIEGHQHAPRRKADEQEDYRPAI